MIYLKINQKLELIRKVFAEAEKRRGKEGILAVESIGTLRSEFDWLRLIDIVLD